SIKEALAEGSRELHDADPQNNRRTARILLAHVIGATQERLLTKLDDEITTAQYAAYLDSISRRVRGEPLQHITGHQEFYGLDFLVSPAVLIPRPETEFLVDQVLKLARPAGPISGLRVMGQTGDCTDPRRPEGLGQKSNPVVVDIGTGSGCIAISLAVNLPGVRIIATDISEPALEVARKNAGIRGVADRIEFVQGDLLCPRERYGLKENVAIIACNPPYVPLGQPDLVQGVVRDFEPATALYGGNDGLDLYRRLVVEALEYLKPGGYMVCEIGYSQLAGVRAIVDGMSWEILDVTHDLQGIPRTLTLRKKPLAG